MEGMRASVARSSALPLMVEMVREGRADSPRCSNEVENQTHLMVRCAAYDDSRARMYEGIKRVVGERVWKGYATDSALAEWLLRDQKCDLPVKQFLAEAFNTRTELMDR